MKPRILLFLFLATAVNSFSQNQNSIWVFGDSAGIDFSNVNNPVTFASGMDGRGSCVSIADTNGNLLFNAFSRAGIGAFSTYTFNSAHELMQNGDLIAGEAWYNELVIIPIPDSSNYFYLFSAGESAPNKGFYYSKIDMNQNGGLGVVTQKNIQLNTFRNADCVQAIKHGNGRDWWVFSKYSNLNGTTHNRFYVYLVASAGISAPIIQDLGNATDADFQKMIFNSNGTKFMLINNGGFMCEYNFDRCTGIISNPNIIYPEQTAGYNRYFWEGAYSPDDSKFYVSSIWFYAPQSDTSWVLQYDLNAPDIASSSDTLFYIKDPVNGGAIRLAPNGKIYYSCFYNWGFPGYPYPDSTRNVYNENLGVINYPDSLGAACDFQPYSFYLGGKRTYWGLPNNPNYSLGALAGSACDTLTTNSPTLTLPKGEGIAIAPNPFTSEISITLQNQNLKKATISIKNILGQTVFEAPLPTSPQRGEEFSTRLDLSFLERGIYLMEMVVDGERIVKKIIKE